MSMNTSQQQRKAAEEFAADWAGKGYEKGQSQPFWLSLLQRVFWIDKPEEFIQFEEQVHIDTTSFIDGYIPVTKVLIEQKKLGRSLREPIVQSDGSRLTPYQQALRYSMRLPYSSRPRWIVTCNFEEFLVYDMEHPNSEPQSVLLKDLGTEYYRLAFLIDVHDENIERETNLSIKAGELIGRLYDALLKQYADPRNPESLKSLNALCVRMVFCFYAEDSGLFGKHNCFKDYIESFNLSHVRQGLIDLFKVLDTKPEDRDKYLDEALAAFPYVNGGLFSDENIEIPRFNEEIVYLMTKDCCTFDWSTISPTIFGSVFESTLNPETRRSGGMHYTSVENIHKVIDPLFLDDLKDEFDRIKHIPVDKTRSKELRDFQDRLASLTFLDPACGSGNFLTETYISLRKIENEIIRELSTTGVAIIGGGFSPIIVSIDQFYGIEINDFAATVAKTALWIAESQMMLATEGIVQSDFDFLPLKTYSNIHEANALRIGWQDVVPKAKLNYIMGNPPFVGARLMSEDQKADMIHVFESDWKNIGNMDYVCCWYKKSFDLMLGTNIRAALVSTNSVSQGEQVANLWKPLFEQGVHIDFAHWTFRWDSEATLKAHVHCVIIGFSLAENKKEKVIYTAGISKIASNINAYLIDAANIFVENRSIPLCDVPTIGIGNQPIDDGNYLFTEDEMKEFIKVEPKSQPYFKPFYGADEYINRRPRYCLWLGYCSPAELRSMPNCLRRVENVRNFRLASKREGTRKLAERPTRFLVENMPKDNYIVIPETSSERRQHVPIGFMSPNELCSNAIRLIPNATLYHFGVLTSSVHMAWMRAVCGRLKSDYRYSKDVVYNNFPWPSPTEEQKARIEQTAQGILDARTKHPDSSLADLYDERTMPADLRKAHQDNDRAVMAAYGFPSNSSFTESDCVAALMKLYEALTTCLAPQK